MGNRKLTRRFDGNFVIVNVIISWMPETLKGNIAHICRKLNVQNVASDHLSNLKKKRNSKNRSYYIVYLLCFGPALQS